MEPNEEDLRLAREIVEAEFGTPADSPIYQTAGRTIERVTTRIASALATEREKARRDTLEFLQSAIGQLGHKDGAMLLIGHLQAQLGMVRPFEEVRRELAIRAGDKE